MRTCYVDAATRSIADLLPPGELMPYWTISRITVLAAHRGKGHGSALLAQICADADNEGVRLTLEPSPSGPLDYAQLVSWYGRYGFKMTRTGYMVRRPR